MKITTLNLLNFRLFPQATFHFPAMFTVLIGENGRGKSALLHGLRVALGAWLQGFKEADGIAIQKDDIRRIDLQHRFVPQFPVTVTAEGKVNDRLIVWARTKASLSGRTTTAESAELVALARQLEQLTNEQLQEVDLPVLAYFSTARLWVESNQTIKLKTKGAKIRDGYARCLENTHDRGSALGWIKSTYYKTLKAKGKPGEEDSLVGLKGLLSAVLSAITTCVPGWTELEWDEDSDDLAGLYERPNGSRELVPLYYLSDGLRTMAGMVAEIAYRCVTLNGHYGAEAVRHSRGVILIDELDMHLHPNWQRQVVGHLKKAFPQLQFIATTHSPFIVQSLETEELINLDYPTDLRPKDLRLNDVAETVMGVESVLSEEKAELHHQASSYLQQLQPGGRHAASPALIAASSAAELDALEASIADPGLRAILRMKRLAQDSQAGQ